MSPLSETFPRECLCGRPKSGQHNHTCDAYRWRMIEASYIARLETAKGHLILAWEHERDLEQRLAAALGRREAHDHNKV